MTNREFLIRLLEDSVVAPYARGLSYSNEDKLATAIEILESGVNLDADRDQVTLQNDSIDEANESAIESIVRAYGRVSESQPNQPYQPTPIGIIPQAPPQDAIPPTKVRKPRQPKTALESKDSPAERDQQQDN
jgi:hypothetical protein